MAGPSMELTLHKRDVFEFTLSPRLAQTISYEIWRYPDDSGEQFVLVDAALFKSMCTELDDCRRKNIEQYAQDRGQ
jgi:hypothetical protein